MKSIQIDLLLSLIDLNKKKETILMKMSALELKNQMESKEYLNLLETYDIITNIYYKNLKQLTSPQELIMNLQEINPEITSDIDIIVLLDNSPYLLLKRLLTDLGHCSILNIYHTTENKFLSLSPIIQQILNSFYDKLENNSFQDELINDCMNQDIINYLFLKIISYIKQSSTLEEKQKLLNWKYRLILLSKDLEQRMLMTKFLLPDAVKLVDTITLHTIGITSEEYIKKLDSSLVSYLYKLINYSLSTADINDFQLELIIMETFADLLNDKEYCDINIAEIKSLLVNELLSHRILQEKTLDIKEVLENSKNIMINDVKQRKYTRI